MEWEHLGALLAVGCVIAVVGQNVNKMVFGGAPKAGRTGWRAWWYLTLWCHPILVGALCGLPPWLPAPEFMGSHTAGRMVWFSLAGIFSSSAYDAVAGVLKHREAKRERSTSTPPSGDLSP